MKNCKIVIKDFLKAISNIGDNVSSIFLYKKSLSKINHISRDDKVKLAVVVHLFYVESWVFFNKKLRNLNSYKFDLFITIPEQNSYFIEDIKKSYPNAIVMVVPNRGRDVLPFIKIANRLKEVGYEYVLKFHSKKSTHRDDGQEWMEDMLNKLLPDDSGLMGNIYNRLDDKTTGIIGPEGVYYPLTINFPANGAHMINILNKLYGKKEANRFLQIQRGEFGFFGGTMFWARLDAINSILNLPICMFEKEAGQIDGTFAHALERLFVVLPEIKGRTNYEISRNAIYNRPYASDNIPEWSEDHLK